MKIFGINFSRKKKVKPKKQKKVEAPPLTYNVSLFEPQNKPVTDAEIKNDSIESQEIILPEKSQVDIDDNNQIGFIPEEELSLSKTEQFDDDIITDKDNIASTFESNEESWANSFEEEESSTEIITPNEEKIYITVTTDNIEDVTTELSSGEISGLDEKINEFKTQIEDLDRIIAEKKDTINQLEEQINNLTNELNNKIEENKSFLNNLNQESKQTLIELEASIEQKKTELKILIEEIKLRSEELENINENNSKLILEAEKQTKEKIAELDLITNQKLEQISNLDSELKNLTDKFEQKKSEIQNWEEQNKANQEIIEKSKSEILELEKRVIEIHSEAKDLLSTKNEIYSEILKLQGELAVLKSEKEKTTELIQLSQKRREEIEFSNDQIEKRLLRMIQKFDDEIKELSSYKSSIEKKIHELESKVKENEDIISEKTNRLKETEDKLRLRQTELSAMNTLISNLNEKEDNLSKSISEYEREITKKRTDNQELRKNIDLLLQNKSSIENVLEELFVSSEQRLSHLRKSNLETEDELRSKEIIYEELNQKIDKAIDELVELQKSVQSQKIELEDLEIKSENLKKINQSLENEIANNNRILEQFNKMKEEISAGSSEMRKDFSKEFGINRDDLDYDPNQNRVFKLK